MNTRDWSPEALERAREAAAATAEKLADARSSRRREGRRRVRNRVLRDLRDAETHVARASQRLARSVDAGIATYSERKAESRQERGEVEAAVLAPVHWMQGAATMMRESAEIPSELAKALDNRTFRRVVRFTLLPPLRGVRRR